MDSKQDSCDRNRYVFFKNNVCNKHDHHANTAMKKDINQVVAPRIETRNVVIEAKRGDAYGSIRAMTAAVLQWCAPEIVK